MKGGGEAGKEGEQRQKPTVLPTAVTAGHCGCIHPARRLGPSTISFIILLAASVMLRILDNHRVASETRSGAARNGIKKDI